MALLRVWPDSLLRAFAISVLSCVLCPFNLYAAEQAKDVSKMIAEMRGVIASAKVVVNRANVHFFSSIDEAELNRIGCLYQAKDSKDFGSLLDIVAGAQIIETTPFFLSGKRGISARIGIYLTNNDGANLRCSYGPSKG